MLQRNQLVPPTRTILANYISLVMLSKMEQLTDEAVIIVLVQSTMFVVCTVIRIQWLDLDSRIMTSSCEWTL